MLKYKHNFSGIKKGNPSAKAKTTNPKQNQ